jgi:hypothetical protein
MAVGRDRERGSLRVGEVETAVGAKRGGEGGRRGATARQELEHAALGKRRERKSGG